MASIKDSQDLGRWLENKPDVYAQAMTARIALRVLPLFSIPERSDLTLGVWRASVISWAARNYPAHEIGDAADAAARAAADAAYVTRATPAAYVTRAARAARAAADAAARAAAYAADAADAAARATADVAAYAAAADAAVRLDILAAIDTDLTYLETVALARPRDAVSALICKPLWPYGEPIWAEQSWFERAQEFLSWEQDWDIWVDWYNQRLRGSPIAFSRLSIPYDDVTASIATETDHFWDRLPAEVNAKIKARLDHARPPETQSPKPEPLPGYYQIEIEHRLLTAKPVAPEMSRRAFAQDLLETLRDLVSDTRETVESIQDDVFLSRQLERLATALGPDLDDLNMARLSALHTVLAAQAAAHDDPIRESHAAIRGALNGLNDVLENLLAHSEAVREASASQAALKITTGDLPGLDQAINQVADILAQSDVTDHSLINALNEGREESAELSGMESPISVSPAQLQRILRRHADLSGQRLVTVWNTVVRATMENVSTADFAILLKEFDVPLSVIAVAVPAFVALKIVINKQPKG